MVTLSEKGTLVENASNYLIPANSMKNMLNS